MKSTVQDRIELKPSFGDGNFLLKMEINARKASQLETEMELESWVSDIKLQGEKLQFSF